MLRIRKRLNAIIHHGRSSGHQPEILRTRTRHRPLLPRCLCGVCLVFRVCSKLFNYYRPTCTYLARGSCSCFNVSTICSFAAFARRMAAFVEYDGCNFLRQRLMLATLSSKAVRISNIRAHEDNPGLREFEASYIRLLDKLTNGATIKINETGSVLTYIPGIILGGRVEHDCNDERGIGYYLEGVMALAPFSKVPFHLTLRGVTNNNKDPSVDFIRVSTLPLLRRFVAGEGLELKVKKRGVPPMGGGEVIYVCPTLRVVRPLQLSDGGKIKRIRGTAFTVRVAPALANRIVDAARNVLNKVIPDVYIYTDHFKGVDAGKSPGFGLCLVAESTTGVMLAVDQTANEKSDSQDHSLPEELGQKTAMMLLDEIWRGGCVDSRNQTLALLFMALGQRDVSQIVIGELTTYTVEFLRHLRDFFQIVYRIQPHHTKQQSASKSGPEEVEENSEDEEVAETGPKYLMSCVGAGYTNLSKAIL
ncbi:RNA 3'-terminal phosphate cyclase-like protein [Corticium candelabrum]|uniref:RNA 3'-terminal phosphate cyclase-like protein n=1 Tax=Corticium candelabrum TaxID=121492 RepID=UPI002E2572FA|nr:RNA 3'-terminal phosphate cyclase-like protein [Corticium candelabrum]